MEFKTFLMLIAFLIAAKYVLKSQVNPGVMEEKAPEHSDIPAMEALEFRADHYSTNKSAVAQEGSFADQ